MPGLVTARAYFWAEYSISIGLNALTKKML
jgi:hypothetical protein